VPLRNCSLTRWHHRWPSFQLYLDARSAEISVQGVCAGRPGLTSGSIYLPGWDMHTGFQHLSIEVISVLQRMAI